MLQTGLLRRATSVKDFTIRQLSSKRFKVVATGATLFSVSYALLPSDRKKDVKCIVGSSIRFARSIRIGVTISMDYLIGPIIGYTDSEIHQRSADRLVHGCMQNGGIYIKVGQGLAAVNHILPKEYIETLSALQDKCLTQKKSEVDEIFLQEFGKKPEEMLREIESEPVAAASLAQVYKAVTLDGDKVAIKVQYMNLQDRFISDLKGIVYLLKAITYVHPKFDLHWIFAEIIDRLHLELDFENEGRNSEQCAKDLKKFKYAYVPKVYWNLSTKRILVTEWIDGVKITDVKGIKDQGLNLADVDKKLITLMGEQIFHTGFVHADPHPGNVFVRKGKDKKAEIVLLDHGLYENMSENTRHILCNFWESLVLRNDVSLQALASDLNVDGNMTLDEYMQKRAQERFDKISTALKSMPKTMMLVIRNLNTVRAIIREHGDIINRYKIMARIATRGKYQVANQSFYKNIAGLYSIVRFESLIMCNNFFQWISKLYLTLLEFLGYDVTSVTQML
ncbi:uncharacterized aarF domain-containing protein kinase 5 isoform X2 [Ooceraea biroi]|uniref:uncharacterized aarF domain-containing protein kinase 5 isoform X2 n=1 Tax=Ooceraea biroi TaxID=2015173 RepID=UPI000F085D73|nr:uncharacterized aarF domain-containing protein kinase 5 isoform X2 [Ooceraea biroi]